MNRWTSSWWSLSPTLTASVWKLAFNFKTAISSLFKKKKNKRLLCAVKKYLAMFQVCTKVGDTQGHPYSSVEFTELGMWYHASKGPFPRAVWCVWLCNQIKEMICQKTIFWDVLAVNFCIRDQMDCKVCIRKEEGKEKCKFKLDYAEWNYIFYQKCHPFPDADDSRKLNSHWFIPC